MKTSPAQQLQHYFSDKIRVAPRFTQDVRAQLARPDHVLSDRSLAASLHRVHSALDAYDTGNLPPAQLLATLSLGLSASRQLETKLHGPLPENTAPISPIAPEDPTPFKHTPDLVALSPFISTAGYCSAYKLSTLVRGNKFSNAPTHTSGSSAIAEYIFAKAMRDMLGTHRLSCSGRILHDGTWVRSDEPNYFSRTAKNISGSVAMIYNLDIMWMLGTNALLRGDRALGAVVTTHAAPAHRWSSSVEQLLPLTTMQTFRHAGERPLEISFIRRPRIGLHCEYDLHPYIIARHDVFHIASLNTLAHLKPWMIAVQAALRDLDGLGSPDLQHWTNFARGVLFDCPMHRHDSKPHTVLSANQELMRDLPGFGGQRLLDAQCRAPETLDTLQEAWTPFARVFPAALRKRFCQSVTLWPWRDTIPELPAHITPGSGYRE